MINQDRPAAAAAFQQLEQSNIFIIPQGLDLFALVDCGVSFLVFVFWRHLLYAFFIGLAIARRLAKEGANVVISSRKQENVTRALAELKSEGLNISGCVCHVGNEEHQDLLVNMTLEQHGAIDILVSNAAVNPFVGKIVDCSKEMWQKIFDLNVTASFLLPKHVVPHMEKQGGGSIVLVSSTAGYHPIPTIAICKFSVSKTALLGLTRTLALELGPMNIHVNCMTPGLTRTRFSTILQQSPGLNRMLTENLHIARIGLPEECAGAVNFLCSSDASEKFPRMPVKWHVTSELF
ncbi:dehydrogenase/reductase SDR family member 4-like [Protopterus annectens]|uniref:dehydrogenase/reductase SDR family member 4-like n=1 Tax=Protopterus annectens TaxID=7888 RepID=UPI001CFC1104|nr:dehydrogenase/reductase SDR family member 4-like [Protopterus annectens]